MAALLTLSSVLQCPHGGSVSMVSTNARVKADGGYVVRSGDTFTISGCTFMIGQNPHPCISVQWVVSALRNDVLSDAVLAEDSVGLCLAADKAPQGQVMVSSTQTKTKGI